MKYFCIFLEDEKVEPQCITDVTMLFSDIVGFTSICSSCSPMDVINMLSSLYTNFDHCCGELDVYKVSLDMVTERDNKKNTFLKFHESNIQSNFNGSNTFGTMKISSRQG